MQCLGPKNNVDKGRALGDSLALLAGYTAAHTYYKIWVCLFKMFPAAQLVKDFFLGFFADRAGIEQNNISVSRIVCGYHSVAVA